MFIKTNSLTNNWLSLSFHHYSGTSPPIDYTIQKVIPSRVNRTLFVLISIMATIGIVLAVVFLSINIKYRNQRWVKSIWKIYLPQVKCFNIISPMTKYLIHEILLLNSVNSRYIKMSSPYLNNLIIIGCILTYTSVIILGLDSGLTSEYNFPYICAVS